MQGHLGRWRCCWGNMPAVLGRNFPPLLPVLPVTMFNPVERGRGVLCVVVLASGRTGCGSCGRSLSHTPSYSSACSPPPRALSLSQAVPLPARTSHRGACGCCLVPVSQQGTPYTLTPGWSRGSSGALAVRLCPSQWVQCLARPCPSAGWNRCSWARAGRAVRTIPCLLPRHTLFTPGFFYGCDCPSPSNATSREPLPQALLALGWSQLPQHFPDKAKPQELPEH